MLKTILTFRCPHIRLWPATLAYIWNGNKCNLRYQDEFESRFAEIAKISFKSLSSLKNHAKDLVKFRYLEKVFYL